jgi:2-(1,2-epoxy-1,2-dihydrophenyl)acetyl-CoA isomerase
MTGILVEQKKATAIITIDRQNVYNALGKEAKAAIVTTIEEAGKNNELRSIVLTGAGKAFCTGQDLNDRHIQASEQKVDLGHTLETEWNPLVNAIRLSKLPVIAAVNGVCAGAGISIALACDLVISAPAVKFVSGFSKLGLAPDAGSTYTIGRAIGRHRALDFFLSNNPLSSEELLSAGLVNAIDGDPLTHALAKSQMINELAPRSVALIRRNLREALDVPFAQSMLNELEAQRILGNTLDYQEGVKAFFEKRRPEFKGL